MQRRVIVHVIPAFRRILELQSKRPDFNPLIEQATVQQPERKMTTQSQATFAVGLIETQGFTAVFEAIDTAVKTAAVEVVAREKLGGGYITVVIKGDVAAVRAAVEAGRAKVEGLGRLIAAHVIPSPSKASYRCFPRNEGSRRRSGSFSRP